MYVRLLSIVILLMWLVPHKTFASTREQMILEYAERLITQLSYILTTQDGRKIAPFLSYYINENAQFQKQTQLFIAPQNEEEEPRLLENRTLTMDKNEYIDHLINIASTPQAYVFNARVENIVRMDSSRTAVISVNIEEIALESIKNNQEEDNKVRVMGNTNCNFLITLATSSIPIIDGASCIESLIIQ